jgi:outer membrane protein assembly factor BamB
MKNFVKSFIFLSFLSTLLCCAISRETRMKMPSEIEPADTIKYVDNGNIWEYNMVEEIDLGDNVYKVWFGKEGKYPRIVSYHGEVGKPGLTSFHTTNFNKVREIEDGSVYPSPCAEYAAMYKAIRSPATGRAIKLKFVLLDRDGNEIWGKEYPTGPEGTGVAHYISDKGVVAEYSGKTLTFYDSKGNKVREVELLYSRVEIESGIHSGLFSEDGNYFVIYVQDSDKEMFSSGTGLILFNNLGEELWRFKTEEEHVGTLHISPDGKYIIASSANWGRDEQGIYGSIERTTYLLDRDGNLIRKYPNLISDPGAFSSSGNYAIVCDAKINKTYLLDTKTGDRLFELKTGLDVNNARIAEAAKLIGITYDDKVELIQFNGVKVWSEVVPNPEDLWLSDDGSKITVRSKNKLLRFEKVK